MPFSGGTFTKLFNWLTDPQRSEKIFNSRLDDEFGGIATGLSSAILKDGTSTTTARIPFAAGIGLNVADAPTAPALNFTGDTNTGIYSPAADQWAVSTGGAQRLLVTSTTATFANDLAVTGNFAVNTNKFNINATTGGFGAAGAGSVGGNLSVTGDFGVNVTKFNVTASNGNTTIAGTLGVTGAATLSSTLAVTGVTTRTGQPAFSAHKNGTNQTGIATITFTKITYETEVYDVGGFYSNAAGATGSRWTPPAGKVLIVAAIFWGAGAAAAGNFIISICKNGAPPTGRFRDGINNVNGTGIGTPQNTVVIIDDANGTDFYEVYGFGVGNGGGNLTADGTASATYFMGYML